MGKNKTNYKFSVTVRDFYNCYLGIDDIEDWTAEEIDNRYIVWEDVFGGGFRTFKDIYNFVMKNLDTQGICTVEYDPTYGNYKTTFVVNQVKFIETWEQDPKTCLKEMVEEFIINCVGGNYKSFRYNDFGEFIFEDERFYDQLIERNNIFNNPLRKTYFTHVTYGNLSIVAEYEEVEGGIIKFYMAPETYKQLYAEYKSSTKRITNESVKTKKMTDRMLLEGLVNKYGKNNITNKINEMANTTKFKEIILKPNQYVISFNGPSHVFNDENGITAGILYISKDIKSTIITLQNDYGMFDDISNINDIVNNIEKARSWAPYELDIDGYITMSAYKCV